MSAAAGAALAARLGAIVGPRDVLADPALTAGYERDYTGRFGARAALVVRPGDTAEVAAVVAACAAAGAPIVVQGGNTGLVGGGVPAGGEVLLSLRRMHAIGPVDAVSGQVLVGAGATLAAVQAAARATGWELAIDLGARDAATIGGLAATDAGGAMALGHGTMRAHVAGLEAVLAGGERVARLDGLLKDNAGVAWPELLVGSEGTLGVITRVLLQLRRPSAHRVAALFAVERMEDAAALLTHLRAHAPSLEAADFFEDAGVALVAEALPDVRLGLAGRAPCYVLAQCAGATDPTPELAAAAEAAGALVLDVAVADGAHDRAELWRIREAQPEALVALGVPLKLDVGVPLRALPGFAREVRAAIAAAAPDVRTILWGHLGDGNVHVNVLGAGTVEAAVEDAVLRLAVARGGTISAEHGIGRAKAAALALQRPPEELALLAAIKAAFDPDGVFGPGVGLPAAAPGVPRAGPPPDLRPYI